MFVKKFVIFFGLFALSQAYWLISFILTYLNISSNSFAAKVFSQGFIDTFAPTISSSATGTIIYPFLNLFHRQIAFDFNWDLKNIFLTFYDKIFIFNSIFIIVLFMGLMNSKKLLQTMERKIYIILLLAFVLSLYFFTVNIGPLKDLFLFLGRFPGFTMFRNFYDKFALGYVILFASLITFSLIIIKRKNIAYFKWISLIFILVVLLNLTSIYRILNAPLWKTANVYKNLIIPKEYLSFMDKINTAIPATNNLLSIPFGSSAYTVIKDANSNSIYAGTSPVVLFSGVNDISGHYSFNFTQVANTIDSVIINRKYASLNKILFEHNINYVFLTKNIPLEVKNSYLYDLNMLSKQDDKFINAITSKKILSSSNGNYEIYQAKKINSLIDSKNVYFQRVSPIEYKIYMKNVSGKQLLTFNDSFHPGWKLYIQKSPSLAFCENPARNKFTNSTECKSTNVLFNLSDMHFLWRDQIFDSTHDVINGYANQWTIDSKYVVNNLQNANYKKNKDGTIDIELILYFRPQTYFYLGTIISVIFFALLIFYVFKSGRKRYEKIK